jgi:hypothetical protein
MLSKVLGMRIRPDIASKVIPGFPWSPESWMRWREYRNSRQTVVVG